MEYEYIVIIVYQASLTIQKQVKKHMHRNIDKQNDSTPKS